MRLSSESLMNLEWLIHNFGDRVDSAGEQRGDDGVSEEFLRGLAFQSFGGLPESLGKRQMLQSSLLGE